MSDDGPAIEAHALRKSFGSHQALAGVDLRVEQGTVLGVLGPNGAGKTTTVRILATLLTPDSGSARVAGLDVVRDATALRSRIGLAGQYAAVDDNLTASENLEMFGQLYRLGRRTSKARAAELIERFALTGAADRLVRTYSGGMRRRLDLAAALVASPPVLFLDEPTTGLDPRSRLSLWETIEQHVAAGTSVLLTTQYLDEADRLAARIAVIDHGRVIAEGTPDELKARVGGERLELVLAERGDIERAIAALDGVLNGSPAIEGRLVAAPIASQRGAIGEVVRRLDAAGIAIDDARIDRATLDDVFLRLTGRSTEADDESEERTS